MKRLLLIGGSGQLGTEIQRSWSDFEIIAPSHHELEISDIARIDEALNSTRPQIVVNCAAFHDVDRCEREPAVAFDVNALAVGALARACRKGDITFITISTDYVFDGRSTRPYREEDAPQPVSVYGVSKLAGELLVLRPDARAFVVRTCGLYGSASRPSKPSFIDRIIESVRARNTLRVVSDVVASPTYAGHLAEALRSLIGSDRYGLYHIANRGPVSWYDFAVEVLRCANLAGAIEAVSSENIWMEARRPRYSALDALKIAHLGVSMPDWRAGIKSYLQQML